MAGRRRGGGCRLFDIVVSPPPPYLPLFALPRQPVGDIDYAIGLYASALVRDGGTLQIGIGALADALSHALVLRHVDNAVRRACCAHWIPASNRIRRWSPAAGWAVRAGLHGCSEMVNEGFRLLVERGVIRRMVIDDVDAMRRIADGGATDDDRARLEREGECLHGAFYPVRRRSTTGCAACRTTSAAASACAG